NKANWQDLSFLREERWLQRAHVCLYLRLRANHYWVVLTYADSTQPLRVRLRYINDYPSLTKARQFGEVFVKNVGRDPRGTLKINTDAFDLRYN
ncbi:MAG: hypothetical protein D6772_04470, partial [Bacteroidetes bacterium]